jgi:2-phospho-L-lactate/phosphoenolpyruvate guanylyltransferase
MRPHRGSSHNDAPRPAVQLAGSTVAVLPVKRFDDAKQRLDAALSPGTRRVLAEAMLADVLTALRRCVSVDRVVVVTSESGAEALARAYAADAIDDPPEPGHSPAAARGVAWALEGGARRALLVPGDCPALDPGEVDDLLAARVGASDVTVVPDRHGSGTNALVLTPPAAIAPSFGPGSRARHEAAARAAGVPCTVAEPPSLVLDVDTAEDLEALRAALAAATGGAAHTRGLLARLGRL